MGKTREVTPATAAAGAAAFPAARWRPVHGLPALAPHVLAETLDGGQAFRWRRPGDGTTPAAASPEWSGQWSDHLVHLRQTADGRVEWYSAVGDAATTETALAAYLAVDCDFAALADTLPWRSDAHLAGCLEHFRGLRLLRQPFGETLLAFLCSATKQIVQIKQMLALLAARHGRPLDAAAPAGADPREPGTPARPHRLPTWPELARVSEAALRACQFGFRARYIADTARYLAAHPGWLEETEQRPYAEARSRLCTLPGVGEKIADCVLLFGAGRLEAFPVDTWLLQAVARHYGLTGWKPAQVAHFGRVHFGPAAGLAQQYLFAWERRAAARRSAAAPGSHGP